MKQIFFTLCASFLFFAAYSQIKKSENEMFSITLGYADLMNRSNFNDYGSFVYSNQYTKQIDRFQFGVRVNFLTSVHFAENAPLDSTEVTRWRGYATQSLQIPLSYILTRAKNKKFEMGIGTGFSFRHRMSVVPNSLILLEAKYEHRVDYGYILQVWTSFLVRKNIRWYNLFYFSGYNSGRNSIAMETGFGYNF